MPRQSPAPPKRVLRSPHSPTEDRDNGCGDSLDNSSQSDSEKDERHINRSPYSTRSRDAGKGHTISPDGSLEGAGGGAGGDGHTRKDSSPSVGSPHTPEAYLGRHAGDGGTHSGSSGTPGSARSTTSIYPHLEELTKNEESKSTPVSSREGLRVRPRGRSQASQEPGGSVNNDFKDCSMKDQDRQSQWNKGMALALLVLCVLGVVLRLMPNPFGGSENQAVKKPMKANSFEQYISGVKTLQGQFPNQSPRLWRTLKASASHVLNATNPEYPVVIMMAAHTNNAHAVSCMAQKVTALFESSASEKPSQESVRISDIDKYKDLPHASQKERLDADLNSAFDTHGCRSFHIKNLQSLAPEAALILHSYCDNDNAPFKNVMIIMTLLVSPGDLKLETTAASSEQVEMYLKQHWSHGLVEDKLGALLSRVGNNIAIIAKETDESVRKVCS